MNPPDLLFRQVHALASPGAALGCDRFFSAPLRALSLTGLSSATSSSHRILVLKIPGPAKVPTKRLEHQGVVQAARTADGLRRPEHCLAARQLEATTMQVEIAGDVAISFAPVPNTQFQSAPTPEQHH